MLEKEMEKNLENFYGLLSMNIVTISGFGNVHTFEVFRLQRYIFLSYKLSFYVELIDKVSKYRDVTVNSRKIKNISFKKNFQSLTIFLKIN